MTREKFEQYLWWSGFKEIRDCVLINDNSYTVILEGKYCYIKDKTMLNSVTISYTHYKFKEIFELVTEIKLITEKPKPSIEEQLKDLKFGDFIKFKDISYSNIFKGGFIKIDSNHLSYLDLHGDNCLQPLSDIKKIISIKHNNNNFEDF